MWIVVAVLVLSQQRPLGKELPEPREARPISMTPFCELLEQGYPRSGEILQTEAPVAYAPSVGLLLVGEKCHKPLISQGHRLPDVAILVASGPPLPPTHHRLTFRSNKEYYRLSSMVDASTRDAMQLQCKVEGLFETLPKDRLWNSRTNWPSGFGHLNVAVAQFVLRRVVRCHRRSEAVAMPPLMPIPDPKVP